MTSRELAEESKTHIGEYYALLVAMMIGMFLMTGVSDILMMYIALELVSITSYILAGFLKNVYRSSEAALKYVIFGAAASGLMLYGFSILFGLTGTTNIFEISDFLASHPVNHITLLLSGVLILAGFGYKISAVPFHFWTPDVYEGAPITITAFLSVASKAAGFAMLLRYLLIAYPIITKEGFEWNAILTGICVLTMSLGNLVALQQTNMKRLLAYSSIAQAGYILMGVVMLSTQGLTAVMIYFVMYLFMNFGAFYVVQVIAEKIGSEEIEDYKGLAKRMPFLGAMMTIFMMSLTGIPLTAGFVGKFFLFAAVLQNPSMYWLAVIAGLNSVVALYYYIKVIKAMYLDKGEEGERIPIGVTPVLLTLLMGVPTILFGVWFTPIVDFAQKTVMAFVGQ
jgi:NADH-quinone oxidoreductase subunit N